MTTPTTTLAALVGEHPAVTPALDRLGLDYCCKGDRSLADACAEAGLDVSAVAVELDTHFHVHKENHALFPAAVALGAGA